jgi:malate dehydrogenase (quinone)
MDKKIDITPDIFLIGAGIMSATLGILLKELNPDLHIIIVEKLDRVAGESTNAWNNAGTGHAAYCELNYTSLQQDGSIDISKAVKIASQFEVTKSLWSYLQSKKVFADKNKFLHKVPHYSFVIGEEDIAYLSKRFNAMQQSHLFPDMEFTTENSLLNEWLPIMMKNRNAEEKVAATKMVHGTDVDYGELTEQLFAYLQSLPKVDLYLNHEVRELQKDDNQQWYIQVRDLALHETVSFISPFVFVGAGGGSLPLLENADVQEGNGYGGFPVSGQFLLCTNPAVIAQHHAKVYGKAKIGAPPMSVPHLDTRYIDGKQELLFGPFAGFSSKFLKHGSYFDLPASIEWSNIFPMLSAGWHNIPLTKYLVQQVMQSGQDRLNALKEYLPNAEMKDWKLITAGQRVQVIKKDDKDGGKLEFGTELICTADGSMASLLGASPGASTAVSVMLEVIKKCFAKQLQQEAWQQKITEMIPSFGKTLANEKALFYAIKKQNDAILFES